jgi:isopenicillin-N epimerase
MKRSSQPSIPDWRRDAQPVAAAGREFLVRPDIAFLNHGSFGARSRQVFAAYQQWQASMEAEPVEFLGRRLDDLLATARESLGAYVGSQADNLVFVPNTTHGMNIIARSLRLQPGDELLGTSHEYGAVERTWRFVCQKQGAIYKSQHITLPVTTPEALVDQLWERVTARTRVLVVSHITSPTALIFPVALICQRAREQGILTVIDGAHAPGQIDLSLEALGADFYLGNCHKWLAAPVGSGFLFAQPERQALLEPLIVSWGWDAEEPGISPFLDYFSWIGTDDPSAYLSVPAAIEFQRQHDWPLVRAACHTLAAQARARIGKLTGLAHICPDTSDWWGQMCTIPLPMRQEVSAEDLRTRLWDEFQVEVPVLDFDGQRYIRISLQAYNAREDVDRLLEALAALRIV